MTEEKKSVYATLAKVDVKPLLEKKNNLNYLSWAKAWGLVKSIYPNATYTIKEFPEYILTQTGWVATGRNVDYRQTAVGTEVEVTVTIEEQDYTSKLYVMDYRNKVIAKPTYFEINKTQMRCLVKALAFAGLGLDVYAGEDLPETPKQKQEPQPVAKQKAPARPRQMTEDELYNYQAEFKNKQTFLYVIWSKAEKERKMGLTAKDGQAIDWWNTKYKEKSADGEAVRQFTKFAKAMEQKTKQTKPADPLANDPEIDKLIENSLK